jgi:hypothetical protein
VYDVYSYLKQKPSNMNPTDTLTAPAALEVAAEVSYVERRRGLGKIANYIRDIPGIVIGRVVGLGNEADMQDVGIDIFETPVLSPAEVPAAETEVPAPATQVVENPNPPVDWKRETARKEAFRDKLTASLAKQTEIQNNSEIIPANVAAPEVPATPNSMPVAAPQPAGIGVRRQRGESLDSAFNQLGTAPAAPVEATPAVVAPQHVEAPVAVVEPVIVAPTPAIEPQPYVGRHVKPDVLDPSVKVDSSNEDTPIANEIKEIHKHLNAIELMQQARDDAEESRNKLVTGKDAEGTVIGQVFLDNRNPMQLT